MTRSRSYVREEILTCSPLAMSQIVIEPVPWATYSRDPSVENANAPGSSAVSTARLAPVIVSMKTDPTMFPRGNDRASIRAEGHAKDSGPVVRKWCGVTGRP